MRDQKLSDNLSKVKLSAILFDLDGTLVDSPNEYAEAMARILQRELGIVVSKVERQLVGGSWNIIHRLICKRYGTQMTWSQEQLIDKTFEERLRLGRERNVSLLPGARDIVQRFHEVPKAIVTGSPSVEAKFSLDSLDLYSAFRLVITCEDYPYPKPSPSSYLTAASILGVSPSECLVIENSVDGIIAGRSAGAVVLAVRAGMLVGEDLSVAHYVVDTLNDITFELAHKLVSNS